MECEKVAPGVVKHEPSVQCPVWQPQLLITTSTFRSERLVPANVA
jgi:hypothetical protein